MYKVAYEKLNANPFESFDYVMNVIKESYNMQDNPKFPTCFMIAWENGHLNGVIEVLNLFDEMQVLIKE